MLPVLTQGTIMHSEIRAQDRNFQEEVNDFLNEHLGQELREAGRRTTGICSPHEASLAWQKILHAKGWAAAPLAS